MCQLKYTLMVQVQVIQVPLASAFSLNMMERLNPSPFLLDQ